MPEYDNTNHGSLFKNDKGGNEARPDYTGTLNVEGKEYRLAAWIKVSQKTGNKFLSLTVQSREEQGSTPVKDEQPVDDKPTTDEIPF